MLQSSNRSKGCWCEARKVGGRETQEATGGACGLAALPHISLPPCWRQDAPTKLLAGPNFVSCRVCVLPGLCSAGFVFCREGMGLR